MRLPGESFTSFNISPRVFRRRLFDGMGWHKFWSQHKVSYTGQGNFKHRKIRHPSRICSAFLFFRLEHILIISWQCQTFHCSCRLPVAWRGRNVASASTRTSIPSIIPGMCWECVSDPWHMLCRHSRNWQTSWRRSRTTSSKMTLQRYRYNV